MLQLHTSNQSPFIHQFGMSVITGLLSGTEGSSQEPRIGRLYRKAAVRRKTLGQRVDGLEMSVGVAVRRSYPVRAVFLPVWR